MTSSAGPRATALVAILGSLALLVSACGGSDAGATDKPSKSMTSSASATPTPTPTPTAEPLSAFEDKPPVKAARAWAAAMATSVNARDRSLRAVVPLSTSSGLALSKNLAENDINANLLRPGPQPFTPVNVQIRAGVARLNTCYLTFGWALDRKTHKPAEKRKVESILLELRKVGGQWRFESGQKGTGDCAGVRITEVRW